MKTDTLSEIMRQMHDNGYLTLRQRPRTWSALTLSFLYQGAGGNVWPDYAVRGATPQRRYLGVTAFLFNLSSIFVVSGRAISYGGTTNPQISDSAVNAGDQTAVLSAQDSPLHPLNITGGGDCHAYYALGTIDHGNVSFIDEAVV